MSGQGEAGAGRSCWSLVETATGCPEGSCRHGLRTLKQANSFRVLTAP